MPRRLAALLAQLVPGEQAVRLIPAGAFRAADGSGRPKDAPHWRLDAAQAAILIARDRARASRRVIDYEHQTLLSSQNGQPAPAAGWITGLEWRDAPDAHPGLYATIEWTEKAAAMIAAGEYRYISPVFPYDASGLVLDLGPAALTNNPGLDGLTDLAALSALFPPDQETLSMNELLKKLLAALGLPETTSEADALAGVTALKAQSTEQTNKIATLTAQAAADPDPSRWIPMATHAQTQNALAALTAQVETGERDGLMKDALSDGRILPAQEAYWRGQPLAALKAYLEVAQPVAALSGTQTGGRARSTADADPTELSAKAVEFQKSEAMAGRQVSIAEAIRRVSAA